MPPPSPRSTRRASSCGGSTAGASSATCSTCIEFDDEHEAIFRYVFSDTLIVDTMQTAIEIGIGRHRMVTLDGDLLDRSGSMAGGSPSRGGTAFAQAARLEQEGTQRQAALEEIARRRDAARAELEQVDNEGREALAALQSRQQKLAETNAIADQLQAELQRFEQRIAPAEARLAQLDAALARARADAAECEAKLSALRESLGRTEGRLRDLTESGVDALDTLTSQHGDNEEQLRALEGELGTLRDQLATVQVERRGAAAAVEAARKALDDAKGQVEAALARATEADAEATRLAADLKKERAIAALLAELAELRQRREDAAEKAQDLRDGAKEVARLLEVEKKAIVDGQAAFGELDATARSLAAQAADKKLPIPEAAAAPAPVELGKCATTPGATSPRPRAR